MIAFSKTSHNVITKALRVRVSKLMLRREILPEEEVFEFEKTERKEGFNYKLLSYLKFFCII
jgi:lysyl-tRNA synthetase class II